VGTRRLEDRARPFDGAVEGDVVGNEAVAQDAVGGDPLTLKFDENERRSWLDQSVECHLALPFVSGVSDAGWAPHALSCSTVSMVTSPASCA